MPLLPTPPSSTTIPTPKPLHVTSTPPSATPKRPRISPSSSSPSLSSLTPSGWRSLQRDRSLLPIHSSRQRIIDAVKSSPTLILTAETGSGKSTQVPQYLHEAGFTSTGLIACTQPRRVAAVSLASRVSLETSPPPPSSSPSIVSHSIRFDDTTTPSTRIKYITDGMLLREALSSPLLSSYSVIILDEAHERSINTDLLCYLLLKIQALRPPSSPLHLLIMSATLDTNAFQSYFSAPLLVIEGRQWPVDVKYVTQPQDDYVDAAVTTSLQIHLEEEEGDVLCFLPGQEDIETALTMLEEKLPLLPPSCPPFLPLSLYSALSHDQQMAALAPSPLRKIILSTNIAETSLTISGVRYVIDSGLAKVKTSHASLPLSLLQIREISQAEAWQRSGRAGREMPGKAFRLYTETAFEGWRSEREAEVKTAELTALILQLKGLGVRDVRDVKWMTEPKREAVRWALERLLGLSALDVRGELTEAGKAMVSLPLDVGSARALLMSTADEWGVGEEMLTIVSMLTVGNIFQQSRGRQKKRWESQGGDQLLLLKVWKEWQKHREDSKWADEWRLQRRSLLKVEQVRGQLKGMLERMGKKVESGDEEVVRKCLAFAFHQRIAKREEGGKGTEASGYVTLWDRQRVWIHPSSVLCGKGAEYVCYHELVWTKRKYMREVVRVEGEWVREIREREGEKGGEEGKGREVMTDRVIERLASGGEIEKKVGKRAKEEGKSTGFVMQKKPKVIINTQRR